MQKLFFEYQGNQFNRKILYEIAIEKYELDSDKAFVVIFIDQTEK